MILLTLPRSFQSVQMQLRGPVPSEMYHRYVEFRPFVAGMFTSHSLRGRLLNRALHHQHARIYNFDHTTKYGSFPEPSQDLTKQFLELCYYDEGGRIFTYVLTLDGQLRFTETGKEFGIDLLSKHTMHSDVSIYIAFSGEFFIRRIKHAKAHKHDSSVDPKTETHPPATPQNDDAKTETKDDNEASSSKASTSHQANGSPSQQKHDTEGDEVHIHSGKDTNPTHYELIIDNDSGTYRPNAKTLPLLQEYLSSNFPGLKVKTLDCQADEELQQSLKNEQREMKKNAAGGKNITYLQNASMSSLSSSDEEDLDARAEAGDGDPVKEKKYKREMHKFMDGGRDEHHGNFAERDNAAPSEQQSARRENEVDAAVDQAEPTTKKEEPPAATASQPAAAGESESNEKQQ
jgi:hypothetical protein